MQCSLHQVTAVGAATTPTMSWAINVYCVHTYVSCVRIPIAKFHTLCEAVKLAKAYSHTHKLPTHITPTNTKKENDDEKDLWTDIRHP